MHCCNNNYNTYNILCIWIFFGTIQLINVETIDLFTLSFLVWVYDMVEMVSCDITKKMKFSFVYTLFQISFLYKNYSYQPD